MFAKFYGAFKQALKSVTFFNNYSINKITDFCQIFSLVDSSLSPCGFKETPHGFEVHYLMSQKPEESTHDALLIEQKLNC